MNDRDRLAADLFANMTDSPHPEVLADRLIALGWTRLDSREREDEAWFMQKQIDLLTVERDTAQAERDARNEIDEERLARALRDQGDVLDGYPWTNQVPEGWRHRTLAAAIAKAYREDTDA